MQSFIPYLIFMMYLFSINSIMAQEPAPISCMENQIRNINCSLGALMHTPENNRGLLPENLEKIRLLKKQYLEPGYQAKSHPLFRLPLKMKDSSNVNNNFVFSDYFDHDSLYPYSILDYTCGNLSYDLANGYNHSGTDFLIWPFPWRSMYHDLTEVVASAPGTILIKQDGNPDQHCETNSEPYNGICILHTDGSIAWYIHFKKNSLTSKSVGEQVNAGEYLGIVGSSGSAIVPHLHFEIYDNQENLIDPFFGPCNPTITESWWQQQPEYKKPAINRLTTNDKLPVFPECPLEEIPNESDQFYPGDTIYIVSYFKNIAPGDTIKYTIRRPDNSIYLEWIRFSPDTFYIAYWDYNYTILGHGHYGNWKIAAQYHSKTYNNNFELLDPQGIENSTNDPVPLILFPNPAKTEISIETNLSGHLFADITDQTGKKLLSFEFDKKACETKSFDISALDGGVYYISIESKDNKYVGKFIKR